MIEYALLIMLGFCIGGLIAFLLAPTLWHRAVRLTTKRLEATMPMSLSEIEADKDLLRASYAIRIRRLEAGLNKAREKSAVQLVDISKLQMRIAELNKEISELNEQLDERRNAANVFESTIRKRFPELENMVAISKAALDERAQEIEDLNSKLNRRQEAVEMAQRASTLQQDEIRQLREVMEHAGSDRTGRFKRRPSEWTLEEYRSEYDRLNLELSKMRERLILSQERENRQISVLKTELQQLAERIMVSAASDEKQGPDRSEAGTKQEPRHDNAGRGATPRGSARQPVVNPRPWPGERGTGEAKRKDSDTSYDARAQSKYAGARSAAATQTAPAADPETAQGEPDAKGRNELKSLLDRGARLSGKELFEKAGKAASGIAQARGDGSEAVGKVGPSEEAASDEGAASKPATTASTTAPAEPEASAKTGDGGKVEPKLDQVFREIIESGTSNGAASQAKQTEAGQKAADTSADETVAAEADAPASNEKSKTDTLLDRLRHTRERQTG